MHATKEKARNLQSPRRTHETGILSEHHLSPSVGAGVVGAAVVGAVGAGVAGAGVFHPK